MVILENTKKKLMYVLRPTLHGSFVRRPLPTSELESKSEPCGSLRNLASKTLPKYSF